ncbi:hypothetical protein PENSUB_4404 [Penicillium subrubescens]|uniref:BZIP domain-containing protein n=2 Tax=Penicillium subrubescens TaxID=1316194 RepID=A0A1Q5UCP2_9EURO|nr:hypothetical protein PENSUB_4404 [Penicillium subrubescens]
MRLRENKRRNRARQKEYTADLERRLRQFEQDGIRATIEVQSAAKKVAEENSYLRELLLAIGLDHPAINEWVTRRRCSSDAIETTENQCRKRATREKTCNKAQQGESSSGPSSQPRCSAPCTTNPRADRSLSDESVAKFTDGLDATGQIQAHEQISVPKEDICSSHNTRENANHGGSSPRESISPEGSPSQPPSAPCKLLVRFAANPGTDVSQILAGSESGSKSDGADGGLPCESAYKLLMQYATSEEKLEALARTLEGGCVPNSKGGCQVKNETVSQALLDICL